MQNSRKARIGMLSGLQDPQILATKAASETDMLKKMAADPKLKPLTSAWQSIAETIKKRGDIQGKTITLNSQLFSTALTLVQMAAEDQKPAGERLPEFSEAGRESLLQQLYSEAPI
ncbi:MAG: S46 family peptidase, partial [Phycisphaerae bacterium]